MAETYLVRQARYEVSWAEIQAVGPIEAAEQYAEARDTRQGARIASGEAAPILVEIKLVGHSKIAKYLVAGKMVPRYSAVLTR